MIRNPTDGKGEVDVSQVVVEEYLTHGLYLRIALSVLLKDCFESSGQFESAGAVIVDRPVAF